MVISQLHFLHWRTLYFDKFVFIGTLSALMKRSVVISLIIIVRPKILDLLA